ncbi:hypothetical protein CGCA056_v001284 [Colletotrichum aenigma]|uniref:uncharacterized protein n=1 Tax=Colletotrichum aenigma TaxID=1215731 RepID=UPI001872D342|nr:uncharacterized protein CGCA056_v001284 [Colletotrichum aenigma]KAF5527785.1 hypothetical protein CGCA056_v001284 [Colletotrichum aenigma]
MANQPPSLRSGIMYRVHPNQVPTTNYGRADYSSEDIEQWAAALHFHHSSFRQEAKNLAVDLVQACTDVLLRGGSENMSRARAQALQVKANEFLRRLNRNEGWMAQEKQQAISPGGGHDENPGDDGGNGGNGGGGGHDEGNNNANDDVNDGGNDDGNDDDGNDDDGNDDDGNDGGNDGGNDEGSGDDRDDRDDGGNGGNGGNGVSGGGNTTSKANGKATPEAKGSTTATRLTRSATRNDNRNNPQGPNKRRRLVGHFSSESDVNFLPRLSTGNQKQSSSSVLRGGSVPAMDTQDLDLMIQNAMLSDQPDFNMFDGGQSVPTTMVGRL